MKSIKKKPIMILLMAALMATFIVGLCACGKSDSKKVACVDDLEGAKIGVQLGTQEISMYLIMRTTVQAPR